MVYVETYRAVVAPSDCDVLGHMNVSRYFAACSDGVLCFQTYLGLGITNLAGGRRLSFAVVRAESDFRTEVMPGEVIVLETAVKQIGGKSMVFHHRLRRLEVDAIAFETDFRCVLMDLDARRAVAIPDDIRQSATVYLVDQMPEAPASPAS